MTFSLSDSISLLELSLKPLNSFLFLYYYYNYYLLYDKLFFGVSLLAMLIFFIK